MIIDVEEMCRTMERYLVLQAKDKNVYFDILDIPENLDLDEDYLIHLTSMLGAKHSHAGTTTFKDKPPGEQLMWIKELKEDPTVTGILLPKGCSNYVIDHVSWNKDLGGVSKSNLGNYLHGYAYVPIYQIQSCCMCLPESLKMQDILIIGSKKNAIKNILQEVLTDLGASVTFVHEDTALATKARRMTDSDVIIILDKIDDSIIDFRSIAKSCGWCVNTILDLTGECLDVSKFRDTSIKVLNDFKKLNTVHLLKNVYLCKEYQDRGEAHG